jgi:hypothetical protein
MYFLFSSCLFNNAVGIDYVISMIGCLMNVEQFVAWELAGETEILGENPLHYRVPHMTWLGIEPWPLRCESGNSWSYFFEDL